MIDSERQQSIALAIDTLPGPMKEVVVLRVYGELGFAQIARIVEAPLPTVCTRYRRGLECLRSKLEHLV